MMRMFKLALNAGHYRYTAGKRCLKSIDKNETREWVLNDRICDKIENILAEYDDIEILRIDDTSGEKDVSLADRMSKANNWDADFYLSIHHNAGINGGSGGGIVAYVYTKPQAESLEWQKALYNAAIEATGLKGNRATPLAKKNLCEMRKTTMPAVLMECGFMDSKVDVPIILTDEFATKIANAFCEVIIGRAGLTKTTSNINGLNKKLYRVQVGAYSKKANAENMKTKLKNDGYDAIIVEVDV